MSEVGIEFVALQAGDVMAHDEALIERFVNGHGQPAAQFGEADEKQAQAVFGIHGVVGEQAQVAEDIVAQELSLVDDQHRRLAVTWRQTVVLRQPTSPVSRPMPRSSVFSALDFRGQP